jgi:hypothetical protein
MLRYRAYIDYATIISFQVLSNSLFIRQIIVICYLVYILKASQCVPPPPPQNELDGVCGVVRNPQ